MATVVQGRVKRPLAMRELSTGFEFEHPIYFLPARTVLRVVLGIVRAIAPGVSIDLLSNARQSSTLSLRRCSGCMWRSRATSP